MKMARSNSVWKISFASTILICLLFLGPHLTAQTQTCGLPGNDGPLTISGIVNTYYPGTGSSGTASVNVGAANSSGAGTPIQIGDLVLIFQMQDATITNKNDTTYGTVTASNSTNFEFGVATNAITLAGGTLRLASGLTNAYTTAAATSSQGQKTFQVVRIPQYSSANVGTVTAAPWNGSSGGIVALDVAGNLNLASGVINVKGLGFRGAGGVQMQGGSSNPGDYRVMYAVGDGGSKGEGIAGTPRFTFNAATTTVTDNTTEGYPKGSFDRGAPANAGGGGSDGNPSANDENSGGGGGGNGGAGGKGGNTWNSNLPYGGIGGYAIMSVLGGGGGAGTTNNTIGYDVSGGAGGGAVIIRAGSVSGNGTINANGSDGQTAAEDGGGGGGAGGSVVVTVNSGTLSGLTVNANGGNGGDTWLTQPLGTNGINRHGPGGGGGGGVVLQTGGAFVSVTQGAHGVTTTGSDAYGSVDGNSGISATANVDTFTGTSSGAQCVPVLTVTKSTTTASLAAGATATYKITVKNALGVVPATAVNISDMLPEPVTNGFTYKATTTVAVNAGTVVATRTSTVNPTASAIIPGWGVFTIPAGGQVDITFTVTIAGNVPGATYQNPATATYFDPARTAAATTTTSSYLPASSTAEDVTVTQILAVSGFVLADTNHDGGTDPGETWTGSTVYVNLLLSGVVAQSATVPAGAGSFTFANVLPGSYTLVLASSAIATTGTIPAGWILTSPATATMAVTVATTSLVNQNFALFHGGRLTGKVFLDNGTGGGIANNGTLDGGEKGLASIAMTATNGAGTTYDSATTDGVGSYTLWIPSTAISVSLVETKLPGYLSTGASGVPTGGTYTRSTDTLVFTNVAGTIYSGVNFGDVPPNTFNPDNAQSGLPGNALFYPHTFKAVTGGQVVFSTSAIASPAKNNFGEVIYRDAACNGIFNSGDLQLTAALTVNEGDTVCLLLKEMISAAAPFGSTNSISVTAQFTYTNSLAPVLTASYIHSDVTTVGSPTSAGLRLVKAVNTPTAKSGDTLSYSITYTNDSSGILSNVLINDATPSYTTFLAAVCVTPLPNSLTNCTISMPAVGAQGSIRWTMVGTLAPSASGAVTFSVRIQ